MKIMKQIINNNLKKFFYIYYVIVFNFIFCINFSFADYSPILDDVKQVVGSCLITNDNTLYCWGDNHLGQIGDGTKIDKASPVKVLEDVKSVSTSSSTCAIKTNGDLYCWGYNSSGQVGNGTTENQTLPVKIMSNVTVVKTRGFHTCALKTNNEMYCWGAKVQDRRMPLLKQVVPIKVMDNVVQFDIDGMTCAVKKSGDLYCWGDNEFNYYKNYIRKHSKNHADNYYVHKNRAKWSDGKIIAYAITAMVVGTVYEIYKDMSNNIKGIFDKSYLRVWKTPVKLISNVKEVDMSSKCALKKTGELFCWVGNGIKLGKILDNVKNVSNRCALNQDNVLYCWDLERVLNDKKSLETYKVNLYKVSDNIKKYARGSIILYVLKFDGTFYRLNLEQFNNTNRKNYAKSEPLIKIADNVSDMDVGGANVCIIKTDKKLYCYDENNQYITINQSVNKNENVNNIKVKYLGKSKIYNPTQILTDVKQVELGTHACSVSLTGDLYCWGDNTYGQVGNGEENTYQPKPIKVLEKVKEVIVRKDNTCAINNSNELFCWGRNNSGQIGNDTKINQKTPYKVLSDVEQVDLHSGFRKHICAVKKSGDLYCWGDNHSERIGDYEQMTPIKVMSEVSKVKVTYGYTCYINKTDELYCLRKFQPISTLVLTSVKDFVLNTNFLCAINNLDEVYCRKTDIRGLSRCSKNCYKEPTKIMDNVLKMGLVNETLCVINKDRVLYCRGHRISIYGVRPVDIFYLDKIMSDVDDIAIGADHICALSKSGELYCGGSNFYGQISEHYDYNKREMEYVLGNTAKVSLSERNTCSIDNDHILKCWGDNYGGFVDGEFKPTL